MPKRACSVLFETTRQLEDRLWKIAILARKNSPGAVIAELSAAMLQVYYRDTRVLSWQMPASNIPGELRYLKVPGRVYRRLRQSASARNKNVEDLIGQLLWTGCDFYERIAGRRKKWMFTRSELAREI